MGALGVCAATMGGAHGGVGIPAFRALENAAAALELEEAAALDAVEAEAAERGEPGEGPRA